MSQSVAIVDYGAGNLKSAEKAFQRAAREAGSDTNIIVTSDPEKVRQANRIVLPGVGAFADCYAGLMGLEGMRDVLEEQVLHKGVPFLGICVGMQLMAERGLEKGEHAGLGWIPGTVRLIEPNDPAFKVPHMGWNTINLRRSHALFEGIPVGDDGQHAYFVHSYHFDASDPETIIATAEYGGTITAAVGRDNMIGTQFHPEKSQAFGLKLIANFLGWKP